MLDGQFIGLLLVRAFPGIGAGQRQVEAEGHGVAGWVVAKLLRPGTLGEDQGRNAGTDNAGHAGLQDPATRQATLQKCH
ncbi:hypothetical protein D3C86_1941940 [compost metagenome]